MANAPADSAEWVDRRSRIGRDARDARMDVLDVIVSQAVISLENTHPYSDLAAENRERRRAEDALRQSLSRVQRLVESNTIGVFFWHVDGRIEKVQTLAEAPSA